MRGLTRLREFTQSFADTLQRKQVNAPHRFEDVGLSKIIEGKRVFARRRYQAIAGDPAAQGGRAETKILRRLRAGVGGLIEDGLCRGRHVNTVHTGRTVWAVQAKPVDCACS